MRYIFSRVPPNLMVLILATAISLYATRSPAADNSQADRPWKLAGESNGVTIYSRPRPGSPLKEFKAVGIINAPASVIWKVTCDIEAYPRFMPFTAECRVLKREGNSVYIYQRISPKIVADRDYTLHVVEKSRPSNRGTAYSTQWTPANDLGPPVKQGVLRVQRCEGSWLLEPESAGQTRATYTVFTDSGGRLPAFIENAASSIGIRKIFAALRRQVNDPKYWNGREVTETTH